MNQNVKEILSKLKSLADGSKIKREKLAAQQAYERISDKFDGIEEMSEWDLTGNELMLLTRHGMREEEKECIKK